ncbi:NAD(P)H-dependent oxidoreductase [Ohtaekwangia koreensis]|uniref:NAD(P)H dehydrogenase (Quinone) n=1 Tax=Ohtaekwangia koreensis TaxID=688867 RepID=A0A1T5M6H4_9BACT|nr:NAD(P)H-dependent oxidoreductase [Ohtaekwangia koreensis]SKC83820.1 NAD(P)H dehydrogenase (quinone) [Ohtaekwangia koreensis]
MNVLIVYSHPSKKSYTYQILELLKNELLQQQLTVQISDLYAINFRCDMSEEEYIREGLGKRELPIPDDVLSEHRKIKNADCIIFLYPVFWSDCPAKLKGWFDRVYTVGYAYKNNNSISKMKTMKYGLAMCTAGYSNDFLIETGIAQSMKTIMIDDRLRNRFDQKEMVILGGTLDLENVRQKHLEKIKEIAIRIKAYLP